MEFAYFLSRFVPRGSKAESECHKPNRGRSKDLHNHRGHRFALLSGDADFARNDAVDKVQKHLFAAKRVISNLLPKNGNTSDGNFATQATIELRTYAKLTFITDEKKTCE